VWCGKWGGGVGGGGGGSHLWVGRWAVLGGGGVGFGGRGGWRGGGGGASPSGRKRHRDCNTRGRGNYSGGLGQSVTTAGLKLREGNYVCPGGNGMGGRGVPMSGHSGGPRDSDCWNFGHLEESRVMGAWVSGRGGGKREVKRSGGFRGMETWRGRVGK